MAVRIVPLQFFSISPQSGLLLYCKLLTVHEIIQWPKDTVCVALEFLIHVTYNSGFMFTPTYFPAAALRGPHMPL